MINEQPRPGFATEAKVTRVIDADTIEVEVKRTVKVRLLGCNVQDDDELTSQLANEYVTNLLHAANNEVTLFVPAGRDPVRLGDIHSFERILGELWVNGRNLAEELLRMGFAEER